MVAVDVYQSSQGCDFFWLTTSTNLGAGIGKQMANAQPLREPVQQPVIGKIPVSRKLVLAGLLFQQKKVENMGNSLIDCPNLDPLSQCGSLDPTAHVLG